jgi:hypothetical protein
MLMVVPLDPKEASRPVESRAACTAGRSPAAELLMSEIHNLVKEIKATF